MKKQIYKFSITLFLVIGSMSYAQQSKGLGINTEEPKATLDIAAVPGADNNGILIPRVSTSGRPSSPEAGMMIYNTDLKCFEINTGSPEEVKWQCLATAEKTQTISIEALGFEGNFRYAAANDPSKNKVLFKVTNNTGSQLTGIDLSYIRVDGGLQYVASGQNDEVTIPANSSKELVYGISGGNWSTTSTFTLSYDQYSSASITLRPDRSNIDDEVGNPSGEGTGDGGTAAFGEMREEIFLVKYESPTTPIDKTLTISASEPLKVKIPFTQGNGNYLAYESDPVTITDADGTQRQIKLTYPEGNLDIGKGEIEAEISSVDGNDLKLPQTVLGHSETIAQIPVKLNNQEKGTFDIIAFGGVPDRRFNDGSGHDFVYMTVKSPTGRVWINNNLGAEYNRVQSSVFNPQQQAKTFTDINARGSLFQFNRAADGHELTRIENGAWKVNQSTTDVLASNFQPNIVEIIRNPKSVTSIPRQEREYTWVEKEYKAAHIQEWNSLWTLNGVNNPCPEGFRPPTRGEMKKEIDYMPEFSDRGLFNSVLKVVNRGGLDYFWFGVNGVVKSSPGFINLAGHSDQATASVRCIKDQN